MNRKYADYTRPTGAMAASELSGPETIFSLPSREIPDRPEFVAVPRRQGPLEPGASLLGHVIHSSCVSGVKLRGEDAGSVVTRYAAPVAWVRSRATLSPKRASRVSGGGEWVPCREK